jgi:hypothetical protein
MKITNEQLLKEIQMLQRAVEQNTADIVDLKQIIAQGKGAFKVLAWVGTAVIVVLGWFNR